MSLVNGTSNSVNQAEIDQAISLTRAARSDIFGQSQNAESIYASTFVAANSSSGYSTTPATGASVFTPTGGVQTTYGNMVFSSNGIDSDFVKGYGLHLMNISARIDAEMAAMAGKSASGASGAAKAGSGATGPANINNSASPFSKLTEEQLGKLQEAEDTLQKAKEDVEKEEDADKKAELQKAADEAMENYRKLEQEYGVEGLSDLFGKAGSFYKGIDATELASIKNANTEIESMRSQLESMNKSKAEKWAGIQKKIAEYQAKNGKTPEPEVVMSEAEKDYFSRTDKEISELEQKITKAIKDLNANIKSSAAKADSTHGFATANAQRANERSQEERKTALGKAADSLTTKDAKLEDVKKAFEGIKGFDDADKEDVAGFLHEQLTGDNKKDLSSKEFFEAATTSRFLENKDNLKLLEAVYDKKQGKGEFAKKLEEFSKEDGAPARALKAAYDEAKKTKTSADATTTPPAGENQPADKKSPKPVAPPEPQASPDAKKKFEELIKPDKDGNINWDTVKAEVAKIVGDDTKTGEYKSQVQALYNSKRTKAELTPITDNYPTTAKEGTKIQYKEFMEKIAALKETEHGKSAQGKELIDAAVSTMSLAKAEEILKDLNAENKLGDNPINSLKTALESENVNLSPDQIKALCEKHGTKLTLDQINERMTDILVNGKGNLDSITDDQLIDFFDPQRNKNSSQIINRFIWFSQNSDQSQNIRNLAVRLNEIAAREGISRRMKYETHGLLTSTIEADKGEEITNNTPLDKVKVAAANSSNHDGSFNSTFTWSAYAVCNHIRQKRAAAKQ